VFLVEATNKLFLAKTKIEDLFQKPFKDRELQETEADLYDELKKHREIRITPREQLKLFVGSCLPDRCWKKKKLL